MSRVYIDNSPPPNVKVYFDSDRKQFYILKNQDGTYVVQRDRESPQLIHEMNEDDYVEYIDYLGKE